VSRQCHARLLEPEPRGREQFTHQPAGDGQCGSCHDLALPGETRFVRGAPARGEGPEHARAWDLVLCAECHGEALTAKDAPPGATGFADGRKNLHALHVQAARGPRCLPCHAPHAAPQPFLLRTRIPARGGVVIPQEFRAEKNGGWCRTGCHAPKTYRR
jgi:predicted CXXCH cytochrome family protein